MFDRSGDPRPPAEAGALRFRKRFVQGG